MSVYGGSHTSFDATAFTAGAVGGAATVAGALGVGLANLYARRQALAGSKVVFLREALIYTEIMRERDIDMARERQQADAARIDALSLENERLRAAVKRAKALDLR
jgi:hypothetical protein